MLVFPVDGLPIFEMLMKLADGKLYELITLPLRFYEIAYQWYRGMRFILWTNLFCSVIFKIVSNTQDYCHFAKMVHEPPQRTLGPTSILLALTRIMELALYNWISMYVESSKVIFEKHFLSSTICYRWCFDWDIQKNYVWFEFDL